MAIPDFIPDEINTEESPDADPDDEEVYAWKEDEVFELRGKPLRAKKPARVSSVRIDDEAIEILKQHFGTLGNALYFVASGLGEFKSRYIDPPTKTELWRDPNLPKGHDPDALTLTEIKVLQTALEGIIERHRGPVKDIAPLIQALRKFERVLIGKPKGIPF